MSTSASQIAAVLATVNREIWVVTAAAGKDRGGLTATWVSAASIDPARPVMLLGIAPNHFTAELIDRSGYVNLHLLRADQTQLALDFALTSGREGDKLAQVPVQATSQGVPRLTDCLAWLEAKVFARYDAGDRIFYWADVLHGEKLSDAPPLRDQQLFQAASPEQRRQLLAGRDADIALHGPWQAQWRAANRFEPRNSPPQQS